MEAYTKQCYDIAKRVGLREPENTLRTPCDDEMLPHLASFLYPWREAAPFLDFGELHVHDIERDFGSESERRLGALRRWKASKGRMATYAELIKALLAVERVDQAEHVCSFLLNRQEMESRSIQPQSAPPIPARGHVTYADLEMNMASSSWQRQALRKLESQVSYSIISTEMEMGTQQQLPNAYQPDVQVVGYSDSNPPPVPLRTYKSLEREKKQSNGIEKAVLSQSLSLPTSVSLDASLPPLPVHTYTAASIDEKISRLDEEYVEIESSVLETIREKNIPVEKMRKWVLVLPMVLKAQYSELLQTQARAMSTASNVDELFLILSQYWNSLHPSLLEHLIKKLDDREVRDRMYRYMQELRLFRISTTLGVFIDKWVGRVPPGLDEFIVELGDEWREKTIYDLEQFRVQLSRQKCFNGNIAYVKKVVSGSILVVFATSRSLFPLKMKGKTIRNFLLEFNILRVSVGEICILDVQEPEVEVEVEEVDNDVKVSSESGSDYSSSEDSDLEFSNNLGSLPQDPCLFPCTVSQEQSWHPLTDVILSKDCLLAQSHSHTKGEVHATKLLRRTGEFEIKVETKGLSTREGFFGIGIRLRQHSSPHPLYSLSDCCIWQAGAIYDSLKTTPSTTSYRTARDLELLIKDDRVGIKITREGDLEFFINGRSQGVAAKGIYKPSNSLDLYPLIKLPAGYAVRITAGAAQTSVISLKDISAECVARSLKSLGDVESLSLPPHVQEQVRCL